MKKYVIDYVPKMLDEPLVNYTVNAWTDLDKMADVCIEDLDEEAANRLSYNLAVSSDYECVVMRKEEVWLRRDDAECSLSSNWFGWDSKNGLYLVRGNKIKERVV
jgi:hypothetical protein